MVSGAKIRDEITDIDSAFKKLLLHVCFYYKSNLL